MTFVLGLSMRYWTGRKRVLMGRIANAWNLTKISWGVLKQDKELLAFPVFGALAGLLAILFGLGFALLAGLRFREETIDVPPGAAVALIVAVAIATYLTIYFKAALVAGAGQRLKGGDPTIKSSIRQVTPHLVSLIAFAGIVLVAKTIVAWLRDQGFIGRIIAGLFDAMFTVATFLTLPVILEENVGGVEGVKRSIKLLKRSWGENVASQFGFGIISLILIMGGLLATAALGAVASVFGTPAIAAVAVLGVAWVLVVVTGMAALTGIFQMALYMYAVGDEQAELPFSQTDMAGAFQVKQKKSFLGN
ncbi:MAG: DUF6159 family protein [Acidimicrobiales bacterium]